MSIFEPQWMKKEPFYPIWMGSYFAEIIIGDTGGASGGEGWEVYEYSSSEVISVYVHSISVSNCNDILETNTQEITNYISNIKVPKIKNSPSFSKVNIQFKKKDDSNKL